MQASLSPFVTNDMHRELVAQAHRDSIAFYVDALVHNELSITPGKDATRKRSHCDVCSALQPAGIRKFFYKQLPPRGYRSFHFHLCPACWNEVVNEAPFGALVESQHNIPHLVTEAL